MTNPKMKLLVVRHAKAEERDEFSQKSSNDDLRPLTDEGRKIMRDVAKSLSRWTGSPDVLVSSPLVRAVQTAEILGGEFGVSKIYQTSTLAPEESPIALVDWLRKLADKENPGLVCVVGHEPHLSLMISYLLTGEARSFIDFKKSGACLLEFPDGVIQERSVLLRWLIQPKQCS